jgi:hypothetical protein
MADQPDDSRRKIEKGRQDVADTSSALAEKLAILEHRVQETVDGVKHGVDFHYQVKQRPWLMIGGSLLVGYALGRRRGRSSTTTDTSRVPSARAQSPQSVASQATSQAQDHLASFKGAALAAVTSTLWAMAKQVLLPATRRVDDVIATAGAQPVNSPQQIPNGDPKANGRESGMDYPVSRSSSSNRAGFPHPALERGSSEHAQVAQDETPELKHARLPENESGRRFRYVKQ